MNSNAFINYSFLVGQDLSPTEMSGRYPSQRVSERRLLFDVAEKLALDATDEVLDIGCGVGQLALPMSFLVEQVTVVDHAEVIAKMQSRLKAQNIGYLAGDFLEVAVEENTFDKVLSYSVVQNLEDEQQLQNFVTKAVSVLRPGGRLLIGDVSNVDKKRRFQSSTFGARFEEEWRRSEGSATNIDRSALLPEGHRLEFTDRIVLNLLGMLRDEGSDAYVLPQPSDLPWGLTREDILVVKSS